MKYRQHAFKLLVVGSIVAAVFVTNFADADEAPVTAKIDATKTDIVNDFQWSCGGFCSQ